jgi:Sulfotransferase domain
MTIMALPSIRRQKPESVFFYTFHKCASSLFGEYLLKHASGLRHCDYAARLYTGRLKRPVSFAARGYVYGPLRLSAPEHSDERERVVAPASSRLFVRDRRCVFLVRDPRDILVSSYYSFGFTHPLSPVAEIREEQLRERAEIQSMTLEQYALSQAEERRRNFACLHDLYTACERGVLLRYEDMVEDFPRFADGLREYLKISTRVLQTLERRSRPKPQVDASQHRRSGQPGQFRGALSPEAISSLNEHLGYTLSLFGYEP